MRCLKSTLRIFCLFILFVFVIVMHGDSKDFKGKLLDMTYPYDNNTIYWPTAKGFELKKLDWGISEGGWWYASNEYSASEHGGTHADAPIHFAQNGRAMDQIPLQEWIGPAVKIDVSAKCESNRDYLLSVEDIKNWEHKYGQIPDGAWVIMYTGIGTKYYPNKLEVLGTDKSGVAALPELHFPGFSKESVQYLLKNANIFGIAIDTPSIDCGQCTKFEVHQVLFSANKLALENIANCDKLPPEGATLFVIPMLIKDGTGSPARVFAILP
ncbi:cyclase family protein [Acidobacteriota bacterium]